jgi:hypothetical protein
MYDLKGELKQRLKCGHLSSRFHIETSALIQLQNLFLKRMRNDFVRNLKGFRISFIPEIFFWLLMALILV